MRNQKTKGITDVILKAKKKAYKETSVEPEPELTKPIQWPVQCIVGPGLEGAIACETKIGYVNGSKGWLIYRGYDIFDLCAYSTFEEVSYLLLHGKLPTASQLKNYKKKLARYCHLPNTKRILMGFPVEDMNPMAALRLGTNLMRQEFTYKDMDDYKPDVTSVIGADEDSIPMETKPKGEERAIYEFTHKRHVRGMTIDDQELHPATGLESCYHLIAGVASLAAAIARIRTGHLPIEPKPELSHAANLIYMMTGRCPSPLEERIMDISLILHADHGINASTFAAMVVASTLSDIYLSVGSGIAALNGPLHGGANEQVLYMLNEIGSVGNVEAWYKKARKNKKKIMGFGHRVYKAYDPRARIMGPLAEYLARDNKRGKILFTIAQTLEKDVVATLGEQKKIFPNVDFYSGIVYSCLGIPAELYTPMFAVSRVAGWTARVLEYLENNRIFRPRAMYIGDFDRKYVAVNKRK